MSLLRKLASDTAVYGISNIMSRLLNYIVMTPFLTRAFAPAEFGAVTDIFVYAAFLTIAFTYRMDTAFFRFGRKSEDRTAAFRAAWQSLAWSTGILVAAMLLFSKPLAGLMLYPQHVEYVWWLALIVGCDALSSVPFAQLRLANKAKQFAAIKLTNVVVNSALVIAFLYILPKYPTENVILKWLSAPENHVSCVFLANLAASALTLCLLLPALRGLSTKTISLSANTASQPLDANMADNEAIITPKNEAKIATTDLRKAMLAYAMPLLVVSVAGMINEVMDRSLLKIFLSGTMTERLTQIGIYSACYKLPTLMSIFTTAFNYAAEPLFFSNADRSDAKQLYARTAHIFCIVACLGCLGILLYIDVLQLLLGKDFRQGLAIVPILLLANLFFGLYNNFSIWYKLSDKTIFGTYIALGGAAITLIVNIVFIPQFGYTASAWATLLCYFFICTTTYLLGQKHFAVPYPIGKMAFYIAFAAAIYAFSLAVCPLFGESLTMKMGINTLLLGAFLGVSWRMSRSSLG
jgi:O-antigen/teichoic acid export membrane protein